MHHRADDERAWWKVAGIDPLKLAAKCGKRLALARGG
jgi:hypothetical protein